MVPVGLATLYGDAGEEEDERLAFLDRLFETGCTFWDTAEVGRWEGGLLEGWKAGCVGESGFADVVCVVGVWG